MLQIMNKMHRSKPSVQADTHIPTYIHTQTHMHDANMIDITETNVIEDCVKLP